jgi:predicted  nucleic acid-binding Zn-ribbon protein
VERSERALRQLEQAIERLSERERTLNEEMAGNATDHRRLGELQSELAQASGERELLEASWLEGSEALEGAR